MKIFKFNILKWLRLQKQMVHISTVHNSLLGLLACLLTEVDKRSVSWSLLMLSNHLFFWAATRAATIYFEISDISGPFSLMHMLEMTKLTKTLYLITSSILEIPIPVLRSGIFSHNLTEQIYLTIALSFLISR